jgi:hypothetical protein
MMYNFPKHVQCQPIEDSSISVDLPLTKKLMIGYSLTTSTTSIVHDADAPSDQITVKVKFEDVEEGDESLFCSGNFKRASFAGAYVSISFPTLILIHFEHLNNNSYLHFTDQEERWNPSQSRFDHHRPPC